MGIEEVKRIRELFATLAMHPTYLEHPPVITSEDAAKTRGFSLNQGIKAILFTNGSDWVIVDVPADMKVDTKSIVLFLGWKRSEIRMATHDEVLKMTGCEVGSVPPFGHKETIRILVDTRVYANQESVFNIGLRTHSAKIETSEMKELFKAIKASEGIFAKQ